MDSNVYCNGAPGEIPSIKALRESLMRFPEPCGYLLFVFSRCGPLVAVGPRTGGVVVLSSEREPGEDDFQYRDRTEANAKAAALFQRAGLPVVPPLGTPKAILEMGWSALEDMDEEETDPSVILGVMGLLGTNGDFEWLHCGIDPQREKRLAQSREAEEPTGQHLSLGFLSFIDTPLPEVSLTESGDGPTLTIPAIVMMRDGSLSVVFGTDSEAELVDTISRCFMAVRALTSRLSAIRPDIGAESSHLIRPVVVSNASPPPTFASLVRTKAAYWKMMESEGQTVSSDPLSPAVLSMFQTVERAVSPDWSMASRPESSEAKAPHGRAGVVSTQIGSLRHIPEMLEADINRMAEGFGAAFVQVVGNRKVVVAETVALTADVWLSYGLLPALLAYTVMEWTPVAVGTKMGLGVLLLSDADALLGYRVGGLSEQRNRLLTLAVAESSRRLISGDTVNFVPPLVALQRCLLRGGHQSQRVDALLSGLGNTNLNEALEEDGDYPTPPLSVA